MFETFDRNEIHLFLKAWNTELERPFTIILIGGSAAALAYKVSRATQDIDVVNSLKGSLQAYNKAKKKTGIHIPIERVGPFEAPYEYEDRLEEYKKIKMDKLRLMIPEIHDLILMKAVRGYEHDFDTIREMIEKNKVSKQILQDRIENEMTHVIGEPNRMRLNYKVLLDLCEEC